MHRFFIPGVVLFLLCVMSCSSLPAPRKNYSLLALSALLPVPENGYLYKSQKLILCRLEDGDLDTDNIFMTDNVSRDLFYSYNVPPGCYAVAGCVAETPAGDMNERLVFVFRKDSALRCTVCVGEKAVKFGGRLQFDYLPYDDLIADDFQKKVLKWFNPLIITGGTYPLNNIFFRYRIYMCNSAFVETGASSDVMRSLAEELGSSRWSGYMNE